MTRQRFLRLRAELAACLVFFLAPYMVGCDDEEEIGRSQGRGTGTGAAPAAEATAVAATGESAEQGPLEAVIYRDEDFVESERNRDPFRSYVTAFRMKAPEDQQRRVLMSTTAIEEMRLIAIISGTAKPKAMLVDPLGVGHVVERGVYVGRPLVIQATGSVSMTLNWRVDRIRENEVVLTRQDPTDPTRPPLTRIIPLRDAVAER